MTTLLGTADCMFPKENKFAKGLKPKPCGASALTICSVPVYNSATKQHGSLDAKLCLPHAIKVTVDKFLDEMIHCSKRERVKRQAIADDVKDNRSAHLLDAVDIIEKGEVK